MWILLEGADGVGKSTLARNLCSQHGYDYLHFGVPDSHPIDYWMREGLEAARDNHVIDRLHLSEEAYGQVYRGGSKLTEHQFWLLEGWLWARNTILVLCTTSWENMRENQTKVKGVYHDERQKQIVSEFTKLITRTSLPLCIYNYTHHNGVLPPARVVISPLTGHDASYTLYDALHRRDSAVDFNDAGIGSVQPRVWLVGDQPNPKREAPVTALFQPPFQSSSGEYLRKAVDSPYFWSDHHVSNSRDVEGQPYDLPVTWERLGRPSIVALGNNSAKALTAAKLPYNKVPHPQWWRRFQHNNTEGYRSAIEHASRS